MLLDKNFPWWEHRIQYTMASAAAISRKRAAAGDTAMPQTKKLRTGRDDLLKLSTSERIWRSRDTADDVDTPAAVSTPSSPRSTPDTERDRSVADTSLTSASTSKRPKKYLCDYEGCEKAFDRPIRLQMHIRSHTNERPYPCQEEDCDKAFLRSEHLKAHTKAKHNDDRNYICTYTLRAEDGIDAQCGKAFHTATRLRRHIAMHEEKEQTKCQDCGKEFRKQETLQRHIKSVHLNEKAFRCTHVEIGADMDDEPEECGQEFANARQLRAHETREHGGSRYFCQICAAEGSGEMAETMSLQSSGIGFATYAELQTHMKTIHPPTCATCGQACETNRALKAHMDIEHASLTDRQRFECTHPGCGRKFTKAGNMKVHVQTVHAKTKNFICGEYDLSKSKKVEGWDKIGCGYSFGTKANLEEHVRTQHLGLNGYYRGGNQRVTPASSSHKHSPVPNMAASSLTGFGYDQSHPIACMQTGCPHRFTRNKDLVHHMDLVHEWNIDDINDRIAEKEAHEGGKFWIGGGELLDEEAEEQDLRRRLVEGLQLESSSQAPIMAMEPVVENGLQGFLQAGQVQESMEVDGPVIDPALMG